MSPLLSPARFSYLLYPEDAYDSTEFIGFLDLELDLELFIPALMLQPLSHS